MMKTLLDLLTSTVVLGFHGGTGLILYIYIYISIDIYIGYIWDLLVWQVDCRLYSLSVAICMLESQRTCFSVQESGLELQ
jgi:hypothetical protein